MASTLSWKVTEIRYGCSNSRNWVSVNPSMGNGDATPTVNITAATSPDDCPSATIFISASTGQIQSVPVTRCIPECSCKSLDFKALSVAEQEADGSPSVQIGTYKNPCVCDKYAHVDVDGVVLCNPTSGGGNIYATVNPNEDEQARSGWFRFRYNGNICVDTTYVAQKAKESKCAGEEECDVDPHAPSKFSSAEQTFDVSISKCWDVTEITIEDSSMVTDVEWKCDDCGEGNLGRAVYTISLSENTSTDRTTRVIFDLVNVDTGEVCESDDRIVTIKQSGSYVPPVTDCSCNSVTISEHTIPQTGVSAGGFAVADISVPSSCSDKYSFVSISDESLSNLPGTPSLEYDSSSKKVMIKGVTENTEQSSKSFSFKFNYTMDGKSCSKTVNGSQGAAGACYYTLGDTFSITCDTSTNKQMLSYSVTNGNKCSDKSSSQDFTIKLGNGNSYDVSGIPGENKKQEVGISDSTTTVEWYNKGNDEVSGKVSSVNVEQCQTETIISFKLRVQMRQELDPDLYFNSIQADFKLQGKAGTADAGKTVTIFSSDWINQPCPGEWFKDTNELCDIDGGSYCDDKKRWRISSPYTSKDLAAQGVTEKNISNFKFVADMATHGSIKRAAGYDKDHNPTGCAPQNPTLHSNECYMTGFGQPIYGTGSGMPRFETDLTSLNNFPSEIIIRLH